VADELALVEKTDLYTASNGVDVEALLALRGWTVQSTGNVLSSNTTAHTGSTSLFLPLNASPTVSAIGPKVLATAPVNGFYLSFWLRKPSTDTGLFEIGFTNNSTTTPHANNKFSWTPKSSGSVVTLVIDSVTVYNQTSNASWEGKAIGSWALIELFLSQTTGWKLYLDGVLISSGAQNISGSSEPDRVLFYASGSACSGFLLDDVFVIADPSFTTTRGTRYRVRQINPSAEGSLTAFTLGAGSTKVDAVSAPADTVDYAEGESGQSQTFNFELPTGTYLGLALQQYRQMTAGSLTSQAIKRSGGSNTNMGSSETVSSTSPHFKETLTKVDPVTGVAWVAGTHELGLVLS
jgi:hypothetical protein